MSSSNGGPRILAVIPARFASTRFPGKPLSLIRGKPMIQHVYTAANGCPMFDQVVVATDDERIRDVVQDFGGQCMMTSPDHMTGSDRAAEVARRMEGFDVIANVQGDQPLVTSAILEKLVQPFLNDPSVKMSTVACPLYDSSRSDSNTVKVVCDLNMDAIYFSRADIPYRRTEYLAPVYHHMGLYAFASSFLQSYSTLTATPLELCEQLEQLRVLEHGHRIRVSLIESGIPEVNCPEDLKSVEAIWDEHSH